MLHPWVACVNIRRIVQWHVKRQFCNKNKHSSIIFKVMVDQMLWIWYCHFGLPNEKNDLNVLDRGLLCGLDAYLEFEVNGNVYSRYATCLLMAYTQNGLVLCKSSTSHKEISANIFLKLKRLFEMMSNTILVCTKLVCHFAKSMTGSKKQCTYRIR